MPCAVGVACGDGCVVDWPLPWSPEFWPPEFWPPALLLCGVGVPPWPLPLCWPWLPPFVPLAPGVEGWPDGCAGWVGCTGCVGWADGVACGDGCALGTGFGFDLPECPRCDG